MSIKNIMKIDLIKDNIMEYLSPTDIINYVLAGGDKHTYIDTDKYTNVFRYIIPNNLWLKDKMKEGYIFTLVSSSLFDIMRHDIYGYRSCRKCRPQLINIDILLVITKDRKRISCTKEFIDKALFSDHLVSGGSIKDEVNRPAKIRSVTICRGNLRINVLMPLTDGPSRSSFSLLHFDYSKCLGIDDISKAKQVLTDEFVGTLYTHTSLEKHKIYGPIQSRYASSSAYLANYKVLLFMLTQRTTLSSKIFDIKLLE